MSQFLNPIDHFRVVKAWAEIANAQVTLDVKSFELEVKCRNRYYCLKPRFFYKAGGRMGYTVQMVKETSGFIGWLPYDLYQSELAQDKLLAKAFFKAAGLNFPATWPSLDMVDDDFLTKSSSGSFGYQISGPYRRGTSTSTSSPRSDERQQMPGTVEFAEQFIFGTNLKVWFWGDTAFYAHLHAYPKIMGDGTSSVKDQLNSRLAATDNQNNRSEMDNVLASLAFQNIQLTDVLEPGQETWIDFRYGRRYASAAFGGENDSDLDQMTDQLRQQINLMGAKVASELMSRLNAPVLYSVDGVVDSQGKVWWLEVNSNPVLPAKGYPLIFTSLFGTEPEIIRNHPIIAESARKQAPVGVLA